MVQKWRPSRMKTYEILFIIGLVLLAIGKLLKLILKLCEQEEIKKDSEG